MNQSKKILAALAAVPVSVVVADGAMAAENETTVTQTFELKNDFIGNTSYPSVTSSQPIDISIEDDLKKQLLIELSKHNKGFTINYTGEEVATYKIAIEAVMTELKNGLNESTKNVTTTSNDSATFDTTELYGVFNNMRVKATETRVNDQVVSVKLDFAVNYFGVFTNGVLTNLSQARAKYTGDLKSKVENASSDEVKIKLLHDYVVQSTSYATNNHAINLGNSLSSHGYALWMYMLLKQVPSQNMDVRYVYGVVNGEYRSWNIVKIGQEWYHLDAASNDTLGGNLVKYEHFLTNQANTRRIINGAGSLTVSDTKYNHFLTIDNQAQSATHIYYANAATSGELYEMDLATLKPESLGINVSEATSGAGRIAYFEQTTKDTSNIEVTKGYLYFINDSQGKYLYRYDLKEQKLELILREQLESIKLISPMLIYKLLDSKVEKSIPLTNLNNIDQQKANVVIEAIRKLEIASAEEKKKPAYKTNLSNARNLYMALTENQKKLVNRINYTVLQALENDIESDAFIQPVIALINNLDEMDMAYVGQVEAAFKAFSLLDSTQKEKVYNSAILTTANNKLTEAKSLLTSLNTKISSLGENESPFEKFPDFIGFVEEFFKKYDSYLPSIRQVFSVKQEDVNRITTYRAEAASLRQQTQSFINNVKIIDENSEGFLTEMTAIKTQYDNLLASQKSLLSDSDNTAVANKIALATAMLTQINQFNDIMNKVNPTSADVASLVITDELIADMQEAKKIYEAMNATQKEGVSSHNTMYVAILNRLNGYTENASLKTLIANINNLNVLTMASFEDLIQKVTSADTVSIVKAEMGISTDAEFYSLMGTNVVAKLDEYRELLAKVTEARALRDEMVGLSDTSTKAEIDAVRQKYIAFNATLKPLLKEELKNLEKQEQRLISETNQATVDKLIADIGLLTEESPLVDIVTVKDRYDALTAALQANVTNSAHLLAIWTKVEAEAKAYQKSITDVNEAIAALSETSTREEIEAVEAAYGALNEDQKSKVINYEKIATLLTALELKEGAELDQITARKVIEMIATLTDESSREEIEAVRAAYEALSDKAKALVSAKTLEILKYYEGRLTELSETAKKEAAVVQDRISRITSSNTEAQIKNIRIAYNALSELAKTYVTNLQKLIDAENNVIYQNTIVKQAKLDANAFDVYMNDITRNSTTAQIAQARANYNRLSSEARRHVTTYEKLVRLETMWKDPEYLDLVFTYYPEYIHAVKPGAIVVQKPTYDPLYIPDDSATTSSSVVTNPVASWSAYEPMRNQNGRYTTTISSTQVKNNTDRNMRLKADNIEIVIPTADLKASTATVGVSVNVTNNQLNIQFTEGNKAKYFSDYVEIHVPFSALKGNASQIIERVAASGSAASFKVDGSTFIIRTKSSGTFKATTARTYNDIPSGAQGDAIRELAKRGIEFNTTSRLSQSYKQVTKMDVALMIATVLDVSSNAKSNYQDLESDVHVKRVQGLLEAGVMSGATSSRFNPNGTVTKQEAAIIIANMYRYLNQDLAKAYNNLNSSYRDIANLTVEARQSIAILELFGVVSGTGSFEPTKQLTRAEFAELLYQALKAIDYL